MKKRLFESRNRPVYSILKGLDLQMVMNIFFLVHISKIFLENGKNLYLL